MHWRMAMGEKMETGAGALRAAICSFCDCSRGMRGE